MLYEAPAARLRISAQLLHRMLEAAWLFASHDKRVRVPGLLFESRPLESSTRTQLRIVATNHHAMILVRADIPGESEKRHRCVIDELGFGTLRRRVRFPASGRGDLQRVLLRVSNHGITIGELGSQQNPVAVQGADIAFPEYASILEANGADPNRGRPSGTCIQVDYLQAVARVGELLASNSQGAIRIRGIASDKETIVFDTIADLEEEPDQSNRVTVHTTMAVMPTRAPKGLGYYGALEPSDLEEKGTPDDHDDSPSS